MIEYNEQEQRLVLKLVYYGPALSGKTTNLLTLHDQLSQQGRGELMMLDTSNDRTIYFDLLPFFLVAPSGLRIKVKVYTVPGQVKHDATRKAVLQRADGIVFVADSQCREAANNMLSFENLEHNLQFVGIDIDQIPLVIQFNKRDLTAILSEEEINRTWQPTGLLVTMASALQGYGVIETFSCLLDSVFSRLDTRFALQQSHGLSRKQFITQLTTQKAS